MPYALARAARRVLAIAIPGACLLLAGCGGDGGDDAPVETIEERIQPHAEFTVNGRYLGTNEKGDAVLKNEPIPEYPTSSTEFGLDPLERAYPLAEQVSLEGIEPDTPVTFTFQTKVDKKTGMEQSRTLLSIEPIEGEADLDFTPLPRDYTVRGIVDSMPNAGGSMYTGGSMYIRHEAIPDYRRKGGRGMEPMTMPFPLGDGVSLDGIEEGDKVRVTFRVIYGEGYSPREYYVTEIETLPGDTQLDFSSLEEENGADEGG